MNLKNLKGYKHEVPINYEKSTQYERSKARQLYCSIQQGKCYYCKGDLSELPPKIQRDKIINKKLFPPNFFKFPVHLHHDHNTDMTLGAVHSYCNAILWEHHDE